MDDKELVKSRIDLVALIEESVKLTKAGSNYRGLCPFHGEKTPSFFVNPEMGIYKCFGCGRAGDAFSWLMEMEGLIFPEALQELAKRAGVRLTKSTVDGQSKDREQLLQALALAKEFYHWLLTEHEVGKPALAYLQKRGIGPEAITSFKLGWSPSDWDGLVRYLVNKKGLPVTSLVKAGLAISRPAGGVAYDRFRGRVMFPLQNARGQTLGFAGRVVPELTPAQQQDTGKYINTPETEVYHKRQLLYGLEVTKSAIKLTNRAVIVEGELDAISSWQAGVKEVVAIKGSALTEEQVTTLKRYAPTLILALDMDVAGDQAARRGIQLAEAADLEVRVARLPEGKDPDELAQKDPNAWQQAVEQAVEVYQFLLDSATERHGVATAEAKRRLGAELLPIWAQIPSQIVQAHWIGELAKRLDVSEQILWQEMRRLGARADTSVKSPATPVPETSTVVTKKSRRSQLEELLVGQMLKSDLPGLLAPATRKLLSSPWIKRLLTYLETGPSPIPETIDQLISDHPLPDELAFKVAESLILIDAHPQSKLPSGKLMTMLQQLELKEQLGQLRQQLKSLEQQGDEQQLIAVQQAVSRLTVRLARLGR